MIKYYCDHCGKEIATLSQDNRMGVRNFEPWSLTYDASEYIGLLLCEACYTKRIYAHYKLDEEFFRKGEENDKQEVDNEE